MSSGCRESGFGHLSTSICQPVNQSHAGDKTGPSLLASDYSGVYIKSHWSQVSDRSVVSLRGIYSTPLHLGPFFGRLIAYGRHALAI